MRLFIAIDVGDSVRDEVDRVTSLIGESFAAVTVPPRVTWVTRAAIHLTIGFLGDVAEADVSNLQRRLTEPIDMPPFDVEWHGLGAFPSPRQPRVLWIGVRSGAAELGRLEAAVSKRLERAEVGTEPFRPHLTLGRVRMPGAGVNWTKLLQGITVRGVRSRVERVALFRSALSSRGPNYTELAHAALQTSGDRSPSADGER